MANKASELFKLYQNPNGPDITTVVRPIIEQDGLYFKDIDGSGTVSEVNATINRIYQSRRIVNISVLHIGTNYI